jgi:hypothetical protein
MREISLYADEVRAYLYITAPDGITPALNEVGSGSEDPQVSVNGGAWSGDLAGSLVAIGHGWYYVFIYPWELEEGDVLLVHYQGENTAPAISEPMVCRQVALADFAAGFEMAVMMLGAIQARTDLIPNAPAVAGEAETASAALSSDLMAIQARTDLIPDNPAEAGEADTACASLAASITPALAPSGVGRTVWKVGEAVETYLQVVDPGTKLGLPGKLPCIQFSFSRISDDLYWTGTSWGAGFTTVPLEEVDKDNRPGLYRFTLPASANGQIETYIAFVTVDIPDVFYGQISEVHRSRDLDVRIYEAEPA